MKKNKIIISILSVLLMLFIVGCSVLTDSTTGIGNQEGNITETIKNGNVSVKMLIPDYYNLTQTEGSVTSRVISPQTKYARLKYNDGAGTVVVYDTLEIKDEDLTTVEGADNVGLPGKLWKATFLLAVGKYKAGFLFIELLDSDNNVITAGSNNVDVEIKEGEIAQCSFFTVPQEVNSNSGSLVLNEMKFFQNTAFKSGEKVTIVEADLDGAEIIRFNADGTFGAVVTSDFVKGTSFDVTDETEGSYYGIWAKNNAVDHYSVVFYASKYIVKFGYLENFDDSLDTSIWNYGGCTEIAPVTAKLKTFEYIGTSTIKMPCYNGKNGNEDKLDSYLERKVYLEDDGMVYFTFYPSADYISGDDRTEFAFYLDNVEMDTWIGMGGFISVNYPLTKGEHTLKWVSRFTKPNSHLYDTHYAYYLDKVEILDTNSNKNIVDLGYVEDFDALDDSVWSLTGVTELNSVTVTIGDYEYTGKNALKLSCSKNTEVSGDSCVERNVYLKEDGVVSFSFYSDGLKTKLLFYVDDVEMGSWDKHEGVERTASFALTKGEHILRWKAERSTSANQVIYLDKLSIVADETDSVVIYPRGIQTLVAGETITYTAKAYRVDGSEISEKEKTQDFTASTLGEQEITMEIDGKTVTTTVNVVSKDYLTEPLLYMGKTYKGIDESTVSGSSVNVNKSSDVAQVRDSAKLEVTYPEYNSFSTDAFFPLKLNVNNSAKYQFMYIKVSNGTNSEIYLYRGNSDTEEGELETRIWLRWGPGEYTVKLYDGISASWSQAEYDAQKNPGPNGVIYQGDNLASLAAYMSDSADYPAVTFTVTNTCDEDGTWLYPSSVIQADNFSIMNKVADLTYGLTDVTDKVKAIHDWIVTSKYYDFDSLSTSDRKRQDAIAVMEYGMCVCEGYANLTASMLRTLGIQTKFISSSDLNHGWNNVNIGSSENPNWRLLDCTWDDPDVSSIIGEPDGGPFFVQYENFLLEDLMGGGHWATDAESLIGRSIIPSVGHTDGVESIAY